MFLPLYISICSRINKVIFLYSYQCSGGGGGGVSGLCLLWCFLGGGGAFFLCRWSTLCGGGGGLGPVRWTIQDEPINRPLNKLHSTKKCLVFITSRF